MKEVIVSGASPVLMPREDPAGKIIFVLLLVAVFVIAFAALVTLLAAVFRGQTGRARRAVAEGPWQTLLAGLAGWIVFGGLAIWCWSQAFVERLLETEVVPGFLVASCASVAIPVAICLFGAPGLYTHIGGLIGKLRARETSDLECVVTGSLVAIVAGLFPFLGWFVVLPLLLFAEFGAGVRSLLR